MGYQQVKRFDQNKAGNAKGMCLRNVRLGYGIAPKYDTAWDCWNNSPQSTGDIPTGVDVPLYYSYTTTINGVRKNYGHINVRLANGTCWSDGKIYSSLTSYRIFHPLVSYKGWSTQVNGVAVLKYVQAPPVTPNKMPPIGSKIKLANGTTRHTFKAGTQTIAGIIRVTDNSFVYTVQGYDSRYPNRILIISKSAGGNGVALALFYTNGNKIDGWQQI